MKELSRKPLKHVQEGHEAGLPLGVYAYESPPVNQTRQRKKPWLKIQLMQTRFRSYGVPDLLFFLSFDNVNGSKIHPAVMWKFSQQ